MFRSIAERLSRLFQCTVEGRDRGTPKDLGQVSEGRDRCIRGMLLVLVIAIAIPACERKQVLIPPEYSSPPPYSAPQPAASTAQQAEPDTETPNVKTETALASPPPAPPPAKKQVQPQPAPTPAKKQQTERPQKQEPAKSPQRQASMQKVNQARGQLERAKTDAAIRTLEAAVCIDAGNGDAFILLARAWKQKGEKRKALEFAKKAELLYQKQPGKLKEVYLLESDLYREMGDGGKAGTLRRKASGGQQKPSE